MTPLSAVVFTIGLVLVVLVAVFVSAPLFGGPQRIAAEEEPSARDRWQRQKRQALAAIKELELDHQMGKLSREDFDRMRARFEGQAIEAMTSLDERASRA